MLKEGLQLPFGVQPVNPIPVDTWSGPYADITEALASIPVEIRFPTMEIRILSSVSGNTKYWFKDGVQDSNLIPFGYDLTSVISGETIARISEDNYLLNLITGLTDSKYDKTGGTIIGSVIVTGGTISGDGYGLYNIPASGVTGIDMSKWEYEIASSSTNLHPRWNDSGNIAIYGNNRFNFNLLPGGYRHGLNGTYPTAPTDVLGGGGYLWSSDGENRLGVYAGYSSEYISLKATSNGYSIRLVKNASLNEQALMDGAIIRNIYNDNDGNLYDATKIGSQLWLTKNLHTTTYSDGNLIITNLTDYEWTLNIDGAMAIHPVPFDNITTESQMIEAYGMLYNGYAILNPSKLVDDNTGWHVPELSEFNQLFNYIFDTYPEINDHIVGNVLKSTRQVNSPNIIVSLIPKNGMHIDANIIDNLPIDYLPLSGGNIYGDLKVSDGTFIGDGSGLYNIPLSGVTNLQQDRIISGNNSAIMSSSGLTINTGITVQGNIDTQSLTINSSGLTMNLNADLLDGYHLSEITGHTTSYYDDRYVNVTGDTMTGPLRINNYGAYSRTSLNRASGSFVNPTTPSSGTNVGRLEFGAYNNGSFTAIAKIEGTIDATSGAGDLPSRIVIYTTQDGSDIMSERVRINSHGRVRIGSTMNLSDQLNIEGGSITLENGHGIKSLTTGGTPYSILYTNYGRTIIKSLGEGVLIKDRTSSNDLVSINEVGDTNINGNVTGFTFVKSGGTYEQYLMADGSVLTTGQTKLNIISTFIDEVPIGDVDSVNKIFTTTHPFISGTLKLFINGIKEKYFIELSDTQFQIDEAPSNKYYYDLIEVTYIKK